MQAVLNLVWDKLLPAMSAEPLPSDEANNQKLQAKLSTLTLPTQKGPESVKCADGIAGKRFAFPANDQKIDSLTLECNGPGGEVTLVGGFNGKPEQRIPCGTNEWKKCRLAFGSLAEQGAAVSGAWTAADTYTAKICLNETPYIVTAKLTFADGKLRFELFLERVVSSREERSARGRGEVAGTIKESLLHVGRLTSDF